MAKPEKKSKKELARLAKQKDTIASKYGVQEFDRSTRRTVGSQTRYRLADGSFHTVESGKYAKETRGRMDSVSPLAKTKDRFKYNPRSADPNSMAHYANGIVVGNLAGSKELMQTADGKFRAKHSLFGGTLSKEDAALRGESGEKTYTRADGKTETIGTRHGTYESEYASQLAVRSPDTINPEKQLAAARAADPTAFYIEDRGSKEARLRLGEGGLIRGTGGHDAHKTWWGKNAEYKLGIKKTLQIARLSERAKNIRNFLALKKIITQAEANNAKFVITAAHIEEYLKGKKGETDADIKKKKDLLVERINGFETARAKALKAAGLKTGFRGGAGTGMLSSTVTAKATADATAAAARLRLEAVKNFREQAYLVTQMRPISKMNKFDYKRFFYMREGDGSSIMNNCFYHQHKQEFLNITNHEASMLIPMFRLFKLEGKKGLKVTQLAKQTSGVPYGFTSETEIPLQGNQIDREAILKTGRARRLGVKSFEWAFIGKTIGMEDKAIEATIKFYGDSLNIFEEVNGKPSIFTSVFERAEGTLFKVVVGYQAPRVNDAKVMRGGLRSAIIESQQTLMLVPTVHEWSFNQDGSFELECKYNAWIQKAQDIISVFGENSNRTHDTYSRLIKELNKESRVQYCIINQKQLAKYYQLRGDKKTGLQAEEKKTVTTAKPGVKAGPKTPKSKTAPPVPSLDSVGRLVTWSESSNKDKEVLSPDNVMVPFIFFGDIVSKVLDMSDEKPEQAITKARLNWIMGMLIYKEYYHDIPADAALEGKVMTVPLVDIPISLVLFKQWFYKRYVVEMPGVQIGVNEFLTRLINDLIHPYLGSEQRKFRVTPQKSDASVNSNVFSTYKPLPKKNLITYKDIKGLAVGGVKGKNIEPNNFVTFSSNLAKLPGTENLKKIYKKKGKPLTKAQQEQILNLSLGRDRGILKEANFSKADMPGFRAARIANDIGNSILDHVREPYNCDLTLIGNTYFITGLQFHITPTVIGSKGESIADRLGLGGYYTAVEVINTIDENGYVTEIRGINNSFTDKVNAFNKSDVKKKMDEKKKEDEAKKAKKLEEKAAKPKP